MGTGSFPGGKGLGRGVDQPLPSTAEVKEGVELYIYSPLGLRGLFWGEHGHTKSGLIVAKRNKYKSDSLWNSKREFAVYGLMLFVKHLISVEEL
jgi:hypothetical protein